MNSLENKKKGFCSIWFLPVATLLLSLLPIFSYVLFDTSIIVGYLLVLVCIAFLAKHLYGNYHLSLAIIVLPILPPLFYVFFNVPMTFGCIIIGVLASIIFFSTKNPLVIALTFSLVIFAFMVCSKQEIINLVMKIRVPSPLCEKDAITVDGKGSINVCDRHEQAFGEEITVIIYDSTDEIATPFTKSESWKSAAQKLEHKAPFGIFGFTAERISGHYYYVLFSSTLTTNNDLSTHQLPVVLH